MNDVVEELLDSMTDKQREDLLYLLEVGICGDIDYLINRIKEYTYE